MERMKFTEDEKKKLKEAAEILDKASRRLVAELFGELVDIVERETVEYDPGPCYRCGSWPCGCPEGPLMEKPKK